MLWLLLLVMACDAENGASVVYVRYDSTNLPLAALPTNLLSQCSIACEKTKGSVTSGDCVSLFSPLPSSPSVISFARTTSAVGTCPAGSMQFFKFGQRDETSPAASSAGPKVDSTSTSVSSKTTSVDQTSTGSHPMLGSTEQSRALETSTMNEGHTSGTENGSTTYGSTGTTPMMMPARLTSEADSTTRGVQSTGTTPPVSSTPTTTSTLTSTGSMTSPSTVSLTNPPSPTETSPAEITSTTGSSTVPSLSSKVTSAEYSDAPTIVTTTTSGTSTSTSTSAPISYTASASTEHTTVYSTIHTSPVGPIASPTSTQSVTTMISTTSAPITATASTSTVATESTTSTSTPTLTTTMPLTTTTSVLTTTTPAATTTSTAPTTSSPTTTSMSTTTLTTSTASTTTTMPNALDNFTFVDVPGSNVSCFYEVRSEGRFSTNGLCAMEGSDPCKPEGLVSVFGNCAGTRTLTVVDPTRCVSTLMYAVSTLCVPWEAMFADKVNPTAIGNATSQSCSTGLAVASVCTTNPLGVTMITGRYTDNLLGFTAGGAGVIISSCWTTDKNLQASYCPVAPGYVRTNCLQSSGFIGWTMTGGDACVANDFFMMMEAAPCASHSMLIAGSGGARCIGWDTGSTTAPFDRSLTQGSSWYVWNGTLPKALYDGTIMGRLLAYEEYMVLPRVLVTPSA